MDYRQFRPGSERFARRRRVAEVEAPVHKASRYFRRLEKLMLRRGFPERPLTQGPAAYMESLARQAPQLAPQLDAFAEAYLHIRFGGGGDEVALQKALQNVASQAKLNDIHPR